MRDEGNAQATRAGRADRYYGDWVDEYEEKRANQPRWVAEQELVGQWLGALPAGTRCLDVPVGTGRFIPIYRDNSLKVVGADLSAEMVTTARAKASDLGFAMRFDIENILRLSYLDDAFEAVVCVRMLTLLEDGDVEAALAELARVSSKWVLVTMHQRPTLSALARRPTPRAFARKGRHIVDYWLRGIGKPRKCIQPESWQRDLFARQNLVVEDMWMVHEAPGAVSNVMWLLKT